MTRLDRLLHPRSIAVFGGGSAAAVVEQSRKLGFAGAIWPVHPTREEVAGIGTFGSVAELPAAPDAAFVGVNRHLTIEIVRDLSLRGAGGAVCFASGFLEAGVDDAEGVGLQHDLLGAAGLMPVIGPNCYGLINYADGALLWPDQHGGQKLAAGERGVAIITQSSNIAINMTMQRRGLPIAYVITAGNQAQTGLSEIALGLIEDERVSALGLHIEGFDSVAGFERLAARAREMRKPVIAMKTGRSEQAQAATISHTASLAGSDAASDALLKRHGIARVHSIPAFLEALKLLHLHGPLAGFRLSSMSCSGGEASVMADAADGRRVYFPKLAEAHRARVKAALGPLVAVANPLDYHTFIWNDRPAMEAAFSAFTAGGFDLNLLVLDFPRGDHCSDADWWPTVDAFEAALKADNSRGAVVATLPENMPEGHALALMKRGIVPLCGIGEALDAAEAAATIGETWRREFPSPMRGGCRAERGGWCGPMSSTTEITPPVQSPSVIVHSPLKGEGKCLDEAAAKAWLLRSGLPVPRGQVAANADEAAVACMALGFPVALKVLGLAHKSEHGAVRLDLRNADTVHQAARDLERFGTGLYVERMVESGAVELIVGVVRDPVFGPVLTVGSGGVLVELLADSATLLLPTSRAEVEAALRGLRLFPLLDGYRGRPKADLEAAVDAILDIARFAVDNADRIVEMDINPLIVCAEGHGAWIADALVICAPQGDGERISPEQGDDEWPM